MVATVRGVARSTSLEEVRRILRKRHALEQSDAVVPSPCVGVCVLDALTGLCVGCTRSAEEIEAWPTLDAKQRLALLRELARRRDAALEDALPSGAKRSERDGR